MKLESADWQDLLPVFRETFKIWSPGLTKSDYLDYQRKQAMHPWSRRHIRHLTLSRGGQILSSLKLSNISLQVRDANYPIGGIGAVYTQKDYRHQGFASELMEKTIELARNEGYKGLLLFSDIDCDFYARFGFEEIGAADLLIHLPFIKGKPVFPPHINIGEDGTLKMETDDGNYELQQERLKSEHLDLTTRHYRQWLRRQPYGIDRDRQYFSFKLMRETYLHENSRLSWPAIGIHTVAKEGQTVGYAITESAGGVLRILEIAAHRKIREVIWGGLIVRALQEKLMRIRAWEGLAADFAPSFNLKQLIKSVGLDEVFPGDYRGQLNYYGRTWGKGMILPFDERLADLHACAPCPLVELDHL